MGVERAVEVGGERQLELEPEPEPELELEPEPEPEPEPEGLDCADAPSWGHVLVSQGVGVAV